MKKNLLLLVCLSFISFLAMGQRYEMTQKSNKITEFKNRMLVSTSIDPATQIKTKMLRATELEANQLVVSKTIQKSNLKSVIVQESTIDTTHIYPWDFTTQEWGTTPIARLLKYYDESQNLVKYRALSWHPDTESWVDSVQFFYKYNESNLLTSTIQQSWQFDGYNDYMWINVDISITKYNDLGQEKHFLYQYWNYETEKWEDNWQQEFSYDDLGNNTSIQESIWDAGSEQWIPSIKSTNQYDNQNHLTINSIFIWDYNLEDWSNGFQYSYYYDNENNNTRMTLQSWSADLGIWENCLLKTLNYNSNNKIDNYVFQIWDSFLFGWTNTQKGTYLYDSNGNNIGIVGEDYDSYSDTWVYSWQNIYDYNDQNKQISSASLYWDPSIGNWFSGSKTKSAKIKLSGNSNNQSIVSELQVYPNPTCDLANIKNNSAIDRVQIYNLSGNEILSTTYCGLTSIQLNISNLSSGIYILKITNTEGMTITKRLVKR